MTNEIKLVIMKDRYNRLVESSKNTKCPGVLKKLKRQIRKMESN